MLRQFTTNQKAFFLLLIGFLLFLESAVLGNGSIFTAFLGIGLLYMGLRNMHGIGKAYFWSGAFLVGISVLSLWTLRLLILIIAIYLLIRLWKGETRQQEIRLEEPAAVARETEDGPIRNRLFAAQATPVEAYEWKDIHVQGIVGDLLIDATQTVLPKRPSLIAIRQGVGKVRIIVPYEVPVRVYYSTWFGEAQLFSRPKQRVLYGTIQAHDGYEQAEDEKAELLISLSLLMGDVEVVRR